MGEILSQIDLFFQSLIFRSRPKLVIHLLFRAFLFFSSFLNIVIFLIWLNSEVIGHHSTVTFSNGCDSQLFWILIVLFIVVVLTWAILIWLTGVTIDLRVKWWGWLNHTFLFARHRIASKCTLTTVSAQVVVKLVFLRQFHLLLFYVVKRYFQSLVLLLGEEAQALGLTWIVLDYRRFLLLSRWVLGRRSLHEWLSCTRYTVSLISDVDQSATSSRG